MKIGYCRWSRPIGISENEDFRISGWYEKRIAFVKVLRARGHEVTFMSPPTKASAALYDYDENIKHLAEVDLMFLELSNKNVLHNLAHVKRTVEQLNSIKCPIIVLWDDPLLQFDGDLVPFSRDKLTVFVNAEDPQSNHEALTARLYKRGITVKETTFEFMPFGLFLWPIRTTQSKINRLVYVGGHSGSRLAKLEKIRAELDLEIYYKEKQYPWPISGEAPLQPQRYAFYSQYAVNLGLQDNTHRKLNWHTGRVFHALAAGVPSIVENNSVLAKYFPSFDVNTEGSVSNAYKMASGPLRNGYLTAAVESLAPLGAQIDLTLQKYGL